MRELLPTTEGVVRNLMSIIVATNVDMTKETGAMFAAIQELGNSIKAGQSSHLIDILTKNFGVDRALFEDIKNNDPSALQVLTRAIADRMADIAEGKTSVDDLTNAIRELKKQGILEMLDLELSEPDKAALKDAFGGELGIFIESINGVPEGVAKDKWWQFWVNNQYSNVGASAYTVNPGDIIEWKFTKGQLEE